MQCQCKSLTLYPNGVLVAGLEWGLSSHEMDEYLLPVTTGHLVGSHIVPIPVDVQLWKEQQTEAVYDQFMQRLTALLMPLAMALPPREQVFTLLTNLVSNAPSLLSMRESYLFTTMFHTE